jgi:hypothetical protein
MSPYAPSHVLVEGQSGSSAEVMRREHVNREASVRAISLLYYLIGSGVLVAAIYALADGSNAWLEIRDGVYGVIDVSVYALSVAAFLTVAWGLARLRRWARASAIVLSAIFVLSIPIGTLIGPYFLYLLLSAKGRRVFAPDYASIVAATPEIRAPISTVVWTVFGVFLAIAALVVVRAAIVG